MPNTIQRGSTPFLLEPISEVRRQLDEVFDKFLSEAFMPPSGRLIEEAPLAPPIDVLSEDDGLWIRADLPGVDPADVEIIVKDDVLTIRGERKEERENSAAHLQVRERRFGRFSRSLDLPDGVDSDSIEARFDKGVLTISGRIQKTAGRERRIAIVGSEENADEARVAESSGSSTPLKPENNDG